MTGHSDPDLHHAISLRPLPFHLTHTPEPAPTKQPAQTSSYEDVDADAADPARQRPGYHRSSSDEAQDVERDASIPAYNAGNDPYSLRYGLKTEEQLETIKANSGKKRSGGVSGCVGKPKDVWRARKLTGFYEAQNENIERLLKPVDQHVQDAKDEQGADALQYKIAVTGSFIANILLAVLQLYGAISSGSLSLFTTMADAIFDPCRCVLHPALKDRIKY